MHVLCASQHCHLLDSVVTARGCAEAFCRGLSQLISFPLPRAVAQRLLMVRTTDPRLAGHALVQGGGRMTGVRVAVVKAAVGLARVARSRGALRRARGRHPRCGCGVQRSSWRLPSARPQGPVAGTWGKTQRHVPLSPPRVQEGE